MSTSENNRNINTITGDAFYSMDFSEQLKYFNEILQIHKSVKDASNFLNISSDNISRKFNRAGYKFNKILCQFVKKDLNKTSLPNDPTIKTSLKKDFIKPKTTIQQNKSSQKSSPISNSTTFITPEILQNGITFKFFYTPTGYNKKFSSSVDDAVLTEFTKMIDKYSYINLNSHLSNAMSLYIEYLKTL
ncbi:hypothetical protein Z969_10400 [Clostridium novyi A str. 4570]|uniref:Uncharacterized protein n=1 Tax=Clostridium novyi A str. 4570 TaxID=1444290 RepID=A0AA89CU15_CLONO|nr:hypothetical protein [Clostridium novyi]KGM99777.1 hypothetical protein Z969_10400 [Clostridium novyi A str. 4570]